MQKLVIGVLCVMMLSVGAASAQQKAAKKKPTCEAWCNSYCEKRVAAGTAAKGLGPCSMTCVKNQRNGAKCL